MLDAEALVSGKSVQQIGPYRGPHRFEVRNRTAIRQLGIDNRAKKAVTRALECGAETGVPLF
jgi:hypothetical protein